MSHKKFFFFGFGQVAKHFIQKIIQDIGFEKNILVLDPQLTVTMEFQEVGIFQIMQSI